MPITRLSNIDQFRYICGNVSPDINIKVRACDFSVNTKSAFLQCDEFMQISITALGGNEEKGKQQKKDRKECITPFLI
tara:strand:+ start:163 stop:396 length:234 start_codon:yes stop_codon:yes gene_type:complete